MGKVQPYSVSFVLRGVADLLLFCWSKTDVKAKCDRNWRFPRTEEEINKYVERYLYRDEQGYICIPSIYVHHCVTKAAKMRQDPSSARKSAYDLFKAGIFSSQKLIRIYPSGATKPAKEVDYIDRRRVVINHCCVPRYRPVFYAGWTVWLKFEVMPELISPEFFREVLELGGKFVGIADYRPIFGRFVVDHFEVIKEKSKKGRKNGSKKKKKAPLVA